MHSHICQMTALMEASYIADHYIFTSLYSYCTVAIIIYLHQGNCNSASTDYYAGFIPYNGSPREELVTILVPITIEFSFLNIGGIACAITCLIFNIVFRNRKYMIHNITDCN